MSFSAEDLLARLAQDTQTLPPSPSPRAQSLMTGGGGKPTGESVGLFCVCQGDIGTSICGGRVGSMKICLEDCEPGLSRCQFESHAKKVDLPGQDEDVDDPKSKFMFINATGSISRAWTSDWIVLGHVKSQKTKDLLQNEEKTAVVWQKLMTELKEVDKAPEDEA
jgi:hypothetical protein